MDTVSLINHTSSEFIRFSWAMLWQSSVLVLILLLANWLLRRRVRAVYRYCLWMLLLFKLVLPVEWALPCSPAYWAGNLFPEVETTVNAQASIPPVDTRRPHVSTGESLRPPPAQTSSRNRPLTETIPLLPVASPTATPPMEPIQPTLSWQSFVSIGWLVTMLVMMGLLIQRAFFVTSLIRQSTPGHANLLSQLKQCAARMNMRRSVDIRLSPNATSPSVCGLIHPVVLIPEDLTNHLNRGQIDAILMHELAHIKRGDLWINLIQALQQIAYFYNPLLWMANTVIRRTREQAVDEMVLVAMDDHAEHYAETLLNVSKLVWSKPMLSLRLIGVVESKSALTSRIKLILSRPLPKSTKLGLAGLISLFIAGAVLLPMAKAQAGKLKIAWYDRKTLVKFEPKGDQRGDKWNGSIATIYKKDYNVAFRSGEKLLIFAELFQSGRAMRRMGHHVFKGGTETQHLRIWFTEKPGLPPVKTDSGYERMNYQVKIELGKKKITLEADVPTAGHHYNGTAWGWWQEPAIRKETWHDQSISHLHTLLSFEKRVSFQDKRLGIWMPGYDVTPIAKDKYTILVRMIPISQLNHLTAFGPILGSQLPDGTLFEDRDSHADQKHQEKYFQSIKSMTVPLPRLTAHKYYQVGEPIKIEMKQMAGNWKPSLDEIYHDKEIHPYFVLVNGKEYGPSPILGPFGSGTSWLTVDGVAPMPVGTYRLTYGWKGLDVVNPDRPDEITHYDRLMTNDVEFEVVDELPQGYFSPVYEEGWEEILHQNIMPHFTDDWHKIGVAGSLLSLEIGTLPFDISFDIYAQAEGSEERQHTGRKVARKADPSGNYFLGLKIPGITWDTVGDQRWRLILTPSQKVAEAHPGIRHYYAREFITDWLTFVPSQRFESHKQFATRPQKHRQHYGGAITFDKPVDLDHLSKRAPKGEPTDMWPLPTGFDLGWTEEDGGKLRIDPESNVKMLWFAEVNANRSEPASETVARLKELPHSLTTEITPPQGERTLVAIRSSEEKIHFVTVQKVNAQWANLSWHEHETEATLKLIERKLHTSRLFDNDLFDFRENRIFEFPEKETFWDIPKWMADRGIDVICINSDDGPTLTGNGKINASGGNICKFMATDTSMNCSYRQLKEEWTTKPSLDTTDHQGWDQLPQRFLFKCRDGDCGIIEVIQIDETANTIKFRYRMIKARTNDRSPL
jgi:beta-lactamase regulating signal transducer with metallopeptidase domain